MAHIQVPEGAAGILGPMAISPESTRALRELADVLLRGPNTLTPAERELIARPTSLRRMIAASANSRTERRRPNTWAELTISSTGSNATTPAPKSPTN